MPLTFIGYRGSGKTTVGRAVADRLGWRFVDADDEIERRAGRSIREIFAAEGEAGFRRIERQVMADLLAIDRLVVAAGGGAILAEETRELLRHSGPVVFLRVTAETAHRRISGDATTPDRRPALTDLAPRDEIAAVMLAREPHYLACASLVLDADDKDADTLASAVLRSLPRETAT